MWWCREVSACATDHRHSAYDADSDPAKGSDPRTGPATVSTFALDIPNFGLFVVNSAWSLWSHSILRTSWTYSPEEHHLIVLASLGVTSFCYLHRPTRTAFCRLWPRTKCSVSWAAQAILVFSSFLALSQNEKAYAIRLRWVRVDLSTGIRVREADAADFRAALEVIRYEAHLEPEGPAHTMQIPFTEKDKTIDGGTQVTNPASQQKESWNVKSSGKGSRRRNRLT